MNTAENLVVAIPETRKKISFDASCVMDKTFEEVKLLVFTEWKEQTLDILNDPDITDIDKMKKLGFTANIR